MYTLHADKYNLLVPCDLIDICLCKYVSTFADENDVAVLFMYKSPLMLP